MDNIYWVVELPEVFNKGIPCNNAVLTVTDCAMRMIHLILTNAHETSEETDELFLSNVVRLHGLPHSIISDRDPRFTSSFWRTRCERLDVKHLLTTEYHPQTNAQAERTNQTIKKLPLAAQLEDHRGIASCPVLRWT